AGSGAAASDRMALRLDSRPPFPAVGRALPRSELRARDLRPPLCIVCSLAEPQETDSNCIRPIVGWSSAGGAGPAYAGSGSLGRGIVFLAGVAADPAGGPDHSDSDDPNPEPDPAAGHLSPSVAGLKAGHCTAGTSRSSRVAAGGSDRACFHD